MKQGAYQLLIDTWEGQLEIDEAVLIANGVAGMLIRLNDINGGHHKDEYFDTQWEQAKLFVRAPYFVYNPWVNGPQNFEWLSAHMPADAKAVMCDIEVKKSDVSPATYAAEVKIFKNLVKTRWRTVIYTGEWFLSYLSEWPIDVDYWWAQYPYAFYPSGTRSLTWDQLRVELEPFTGPSNAAKCPGPLRMWQFTGDKLILPGSPKPLDVNAFFGTYEELETWLGAAGSTTPPPNTDVVTHPFSGAEQVKGTRFGYKFSLLKLDLRGKDVSLYYDGTFVNVADVARRMDAVFAANASPWYETAPYDVRGLLVMDGQKIVNMEPTAEPYLNVTRENVLQIKYGNASDWFNTYTGFRLLTLLSANNPAHATQRAPRHLIGKDAQGRLLEMAVEGYGDTGGGVTLIEGWQMMQEFGAVTGMDGDGGYSVNQIVNGVQTLNVRGDDVKVVFLVSNGGGSMAKNRVTVTWDSGCSKRPVPSTDSVSNGVYPDNAVFETDSDIVADREQPNNPDKKWIGTPDGMFIAVRYPSSSGIVERARVEPINAPPVGTVEDMPYTITFGGSDSPYVETTITGVVKAK